MLLSNTRQSLIEKTESGVSPGKQTLEKRFDVHLRIWHNSCIKIQKVNSVVPAEWKKTNKTWVLLNPDPAWDFERDHQCIRTWPWSSEQHQGLTVQSPHPAAGGPHERGCGSWAGPCEPPRPAACSCRPDTAGERRPPPEASHTGPGQCRCRATPTQRHIQQAGRRITVQSGRGHWSVKVWRRS